MLGIISALSNTFRFFRFQHGVPVGDPVSPLGFTSSISTSSDSYINMADAAVGTEFVIFWTSTFSGASSPAFPQASITPTVIASASDVYTAYQYKAIVSGEVKAQGLRVTNSGATRGIYVLYWKEGNGIRTPFYTELYTYSGVNGSDRMRTPACSFEAPSGDDIIILTQSNGGNGSADIQSDWNYIETNPVMVVSYRYLGAVGSEMPLTIASRNTFVNGSAGASYFCFSSIIRIRNPFGVS